MSEKLGTLPGPEKAQETPPAVGEAPVDMGDPESLNRALPPGAEAEPSDEAASDSEPGIDGFEHLDEHKLVERLNNPELTGARKLKSKMDERAVATIDKVEKIAHAGQDAVSYVKGRRLKAKNRRAHAKLRKFEAKQAGADSALFFRKSRQKKWKKKVAMQQRIVARKQTALHSHESGLEQRRKDRKNAYVDRGEVLDERYNVLLVRAQLAAHRKAQRRAKKLERAEKLPLDEKTRRMVEARRNILKVPLASFSEYVAEIDRDIKAGKL
jgi:hypothetical protein